MTHSVQSVLARSHLYAATTAMPPIVALNTFNTFASRMTHDLGSTL
jgi:hypothetical protein